MDAIPVIADFELIRRIGGGSYGDVWLGRSVTGIYRAIKIVNRSRFEDSRPFLREFEGITRFQKTVGSHATQLALLHVGCDEAAGVLYYVMELADDAEAGTEIDPATYVPLTLKELRRRRAEPLPAAECIAIGVTLAGALMGLHDKGLIHRDVKPSNIIFVGGVPKLADVGLVASTEQTLTSLGTPGYAPPEGGGNAQGDLYSLGKILYELATGLGPEQFPRVPRSLLSPETAERLLELNEVILRACDPVPARRYPRAQMLVDELRLLQAGRSVQELNRNRRRLRLLTRLAIVGAVLSLAIIAALGVTNYFSLRQLAAKEVTLRHLAEADDREARYVSDLHLAQQGFAAGDFGATRIALRRQLPQPGQPDLRGFEWYALWNETAGEQIAMGGTIGGPAVSTVAVSPDGKMLVAQEGERPRDTVVWDLATGKRQLIAQKTYGFSGFDADGSHLIIGNADKHVFGFKLQSNLREPDQAVTGGLYQELPDGHTLLVSVPSSPDLRLVLWDYATDKQVAEWKSNPRNYTVNLSSAAVSPDRRLLAASMFGGTGALRERDLVVYDLVERKDCFHLSDIDHVQWLRFSPDSQSLAVSMSSQPIRIISSTTGAADLRTKGQFGPAHAVEFSSDGQKLASISLDRTLQIWDVNSGANLRNFVGHEAEIASFAWLPDNQGLITGSRDGTWRTWSLTKKSGKHVMAKLWPDVLGDFVFTPDGRNLVVTDEAGCLAILDTTSLERLETISEAFQPLLFGNKGRSLFALTKTNTLIRYDFENKQLTQLNLRLENDQKLACVEASIFHQTVAFGFDLGAVEMWDVTKLTSIAGAQHQTHIEALAWSPIQPELAVGDLSGQLTRENLEHSFATPLWTNLTAPICSLAYSNDGELLAIGRADGRIVLEKRKTGKIVGQLEGHSASVAALAFSPDNTRLVSGDADGMIIFWSVPSTRLLSVWAWEDGLQPTLKKAVWRIKFDPSGSHLAAMTGDGQLRLWNGTP